MSWLSDQWDKVTKKWGHFKAEVKGYFAGVAADQVAPGTGDAVRQAVTDANDPESKSNDPSRPGGPTNIIALLIKLLVDLFTLNFAAMGTDIASYIASKKPEGQQTTNGSDPNASTHPNPANPNPQVQHRNDPGHPATAASLPASNPAASTSTSTPHPQVRSRAPIRIDTRQPDDRPPPPTGNFRGPTTFDQVIPLILKAEGAGYVPDDKGAGASKYGITAKNNGLTNEQVRNLTPQQASAIYKRNYWDAIGADHLPPEARYIVMVTATGFGPEKALSMWHHAQEKNFHPYPAGDWRNDSPAMKMAYLRETAHQNLARDNPHKFGDVIESWLIRDHKEAAMVAQMQPQNRGTQMASNRGPGALADSPAA